jgi:acetyl esterase/lipase
VPDVGLEGAPFTLDDKACTSSATQIFCTDVVYSMVGTTSLHLDLYAPPAARTQKVPVIVYIHGGGWAVGTYHNPGLPVPQYLENGYAVMSIEYRLTQNPDGSVSGVTFPENLKDTKTAIRWIRTKGASVFDGTKILAYGFSAGAHLAGLLATTAKVAAFDGRGDTSVPTSVTAALALSPQFDFHVFVPDNPPLAPECAGLNTKPGQDPQALIPLLIGADMQDPANAAKLDALNAVTYLDADAAPLMTFNGTCDQTVPYQTTKSLIDAVAAKGLSQISVNIVPLALHGTTIQKPEQATMARDFILSQLAVKQ